MDRVLNVIASSRRRRRTKQDINVDSVRHFARDAHVHPVRADLFAGHADLVQPRPIDAALNFTGSIDHLLVQCSVLVQLASEPFRFETRDRENQFRRTVFGDHVVVGDCVNLPTMSGHACHSFDDNVAQVARKYHLEFEGLPPDVDSNEFPVHLSNETPYLNAAPPALCDLNFHVTIVFAE